MALSSFVIIFVNEKLQQILLDSLKETRTGELEYLLHLVLFLICFEGYRCLSFGGQVQIIVFLLKNVLNRVRQQKKPYSVLWHFTKSRGSANTICYIFFLCISNDAVKLDLWLVVLYLLTHWPSANELFQPQLPIAYLFQKGKLGFLDLTYPNLTSNKYVFKQSWYLNSDLGLLALFYTTYWKSVQVPFYSGAYCFLIS